MSLDMNAAGQIDPIVGKLTIASLDNDVDQLDTEVTPCLSDRAFGDTVALGTVPEPAVNALLGLLGVSPLVEVDGDGVTTVLLNLANTDAATTSALGGVVRSAAEMLGDDPVPARDALVQSLPGVSTSASLAAFPSVQADIGSAVQDIVNFVTGAQLLAQLLTQAGAPGTPARDLTKAQALAIAAAGHTQGIIVMNPAPVIDPSGSVTSPTTAINIGSTVGAVTFKSVAFGDKRFPPNHPLFPYNPVTSVLSGLDVRHLVGLIRLATHLNTTFGVGRRVRTRSGRITTGFVPAISKDALNTISSVVRSWRLRTRTHLSEADLARRINPVVRGSPGASSLLHDVA